MERMRKPLASLSLALLLVAALVTAFIYPGSAPAAFGRAVTSYIGIPLTTAVHQVATEGDSLTYGYYTTNEDQTYRALLDEHLSATDVAFAGTGPGVSAQQVSQLFASGQTAVPSGTGLILVELGTNDVGNGRTTAQFASDFGNIIWWTRREAPTTPIVCLGIWAYQGEPYPSGATEQSYDSTIQSLCANQSAAYVPIYPYFWDDGHAGTQTWNGPSDGWHPDDAADADIYHDIAAALG